jgi:hypothetical protein
MKRLSRIATVAVFLCLPVGAVFAQSSDQQAPAAAPAPPAPPPPPATTAPPAPAATTAAPAATPAPTAAPTTTDAKPTTTTKKKRTYAGPSRPTQKEIDQSIQNGTVPSRYRSQVPKEYQQYVPFEK